MAVSQIKEKHADANQIMNRINKNKSTPKYIGVKLQHTKEKQKNLKRDE